MKTKSTKNGKKLKKYSTFLKRIMKDCLLRKRITRRNRRIVILIDTKKYKFRKVWLFKYKKLRFRNKKLLKFEKSLKKCRAKSFKIRTRWNKYFIIRRRIHKKKNK